MVSTEKDFDKLAELYCELIRQTMVLHGIKEIRCENEKEHFFDKLVLEENGEVSAYCHGMEKPWKNLYFDFTMDYATCLSYIEHDLFLAQRNGKPERGMVIEFTKPIKKKSYEKAINKGRVCKGCRRIEGQHDNGTGV